ncbi:tetratricopeptide repeat protein [Streptomyces sp. NPDC051315]|uniref:tetratricopeptide repeat protein n=1 Tax=Streptomyces sp. NPDC051315 TaxID=3365650 RepID=UPI003799511E
MQPGGAGENGAAAPHRYRDHIDFRGGRFHGPVAVYHGCDHAPATALSDLPAPRAGFTGRDRELAVLLDGLRPSAGTRAGTPVMWAVTGLGGIGKTALALQAAHIAQGNGWFTGGTLFLDLAGYDDTPRTPAQAVTSLLHTLGVGGIQLPSDEVDQYRLYRSRLALLADQGKRVLLLFDNVCEPGQLPPLLPGGDAHRVVFTSRESPESLPARELVLQPLRPEESAALIEGALRLREAGDDRPEREADSVEELAALCGHLPLALQIAAALLRHRRSRGRVASLVEELRTRTDRAATLSSRGVDQYGRPLALSPVLEASVRRLPADRAHTLCLLAQVPCVDYGTDTAAVATGLGEPAALDMLEDLAQAHLVTLEQPRDEAPVRWHIHDLVRGYATTRAGSDPRLTAAGREARARLRRHYRAQAQRFDLLHRPVPARAPQAAAIARRSAALAWFDREHANLVAAALWPDEGDPEVGVGLALHLAEYLRWRRFFEDWIAVGQTARPLARRMNDDHAEAAVCNHLGNALLRAERPVEAVEPLTHAAVLFRRAGDRAGEGLAWNNLGLAQRRSGHPGAALTLHVRARDRFRALGDRWNEGRAWHNLGLALDAAGRHAEAVGAFRRACALHGTTDRIFHGDSLNSLGCALQAEGRAEESVTAFQESLRIRQEYDNWYATGLTAYNLAHALENTGRQDEAARARAQAVEACARAGTTAAVYGHHH